MEILKGEGVRVCVCACVRACVSERFTKKKPSVWEIWIFSRTVTTH